jgi:hypothetical protein
VNVPPAPLIVTGKSNVSPAVVIVLVPDVAANVNVLVPAVRVMAETKVKLPYMVHVVFAKVPENPVKLRFKAPLIDTVSVPAEILKLI